MFEIFNGRFVYISTKPPNPQAGYGDEVVVPASACKALQFKGTFKCRDVQFGLWGSGWIIMVNTITVHLFTV